jgi:hypothetical protein
MRIEEILSFETFITSVSFGDDSMEVMFLEKNEQTDTIMMARTMIIPIEGNDERVQIYGDIQDALRHMIEGAYVELRNPPSEYSDSSKWAYRKMVEES